MNYIQWFLFLGVLSTQFSYVNAASGQPDALKEKVEQLLRSFAGIQERFSESAGHDRAPSDAYFEIGVGANSKGEICIALGRRRSTGWFKCPELMVCDSQLFVDVLGPLLKRMLQKFGTNLHRIVFDGLHLIDTDDRDTAGDVLGRWIAQQNQENHLVQLIRDPNSDRIEVLTPGEVRSKDSEGRWVRRERCWGLMHDLTYVRHDPWMPVARITVKDGQFNLLDYNCGRFLHPGGLVSLHEDPRTGTFRDMKRSLQTKGMIVIAFMLLYLFLDSYLTSQCPCV